MTAVITQAQTVPDFEGEPVDHVAIKFSGSGTGLSGDLEIEPIVLEVGDTVFLVSELTCVGVEHGLDRKENLVRTHRLKFEKAAPVDRDLAQKTINAYAARIEQTKREIDGQMMLDAENEALAKEAADRGESNVHAKA